MIQPHADSSRMSHESHRPGGGRRASWRRLLALPAVAVGIALLRSLPAGAPADEASAAARDVGRIADLSGRPIPRLLFVARRPGADGESRAIPGLGPGGRTRVTSGMLMVREPRGAVRPFLAPNPFLDVSDPAVSWDGTTVVFAGVTHPDSSWRLWVADAAGAGIRPLTRTGRPLLASEEEALSPGLRRYDDFDPAFLPDGRVVFASTRFPQKSQRDDLAVSNLFVIALDGTGLTRITSERNGGEEPSIDAKTGRIVYSRWWFNRYLPTNDGKIGITTDPARALPREPINLWQAISIFPDGDHMRLAGGDPRLRVSTMIYQPAVRADGLLIGVRPEDPGEATSLYRPRLHAFPDGFSEAVPVLSAPACAPMFLPDGRLLVSWTPSGARDLGLYLLDDALEGVRRVVDLPGTDELDATVLAARPLPPVLPTNIPDAPPRVPYARPDTLIDTQHTFRFDCLNVFTNAAVDRPFPDAPPPQKGLRIRFFAVLSRPHEAGGDTLVLVREAPLDDNGSVHEHDLPADTPMFEQLVDRDGRVLESTAGPSHVPGYNFARFGTGTKCVGCHTGHSALEGPVNYAQAAPFNAAPGAEVTASSLAPGCASARGAVDRRTLGRPSEVAWVAASAGDEKIRLSWRTLIDLQAVVLYAVKTSPKEGTDLRTLESELVLFRDGLELRRVTINAELQPGGTRVEFEPLRIDALEYRPRRTTGRVEGQNVAGLGEIEVVATLTPDN